jgi:hypothetical protein
MHRCYRRPGIARPIDDIFASRPERRKTVRLTANARRERLSKLISRLISQHDPDDFSEAPDDRRIALRQPADERPFEAYCGDAEPQLLWLEDVSRTGMRFRSLCAFPCGSQVTVCPSEGLQLLPITLRVLRVQLIDPLLPERGYEYGGEFVERDERTHAWYLATRARR